MGGDEAAGGTDRFHDRYGVVGFAEQGLQRSLDADAGQEEGKDADKVEEKEKVLKKSLYTGVALSEGSDVFLALNRGPRQVHRQAGLPVPGHGP